MTPKQKADELVNKYYAYQPLLSKKEAKIFALICCNEVIEQNDIWILKTGKGNNNYWEEVKTEINKL